MRMRSLNSTELNALIFRNQKQNKTFNKTIDLLVQITKPSIYWLHEHAKRTGNPFYLAAFGCGNRCIGCCEWAWRTPAGVMTDEVSMAAAASIPASLVRLPLWYTGLTPRLIVAFATCTLFQLCGAGGLVRWRAWEQVFGARDWVRSTSARKMQRDSQT